MRTLALALVAACAGAPPPPLAVPAPPAPVAVAPPPPPPAKPAAPYHDPDHKRGELPGADARKAELGVVRANLDAMYAHRLDKEKRFGIDEDALFRDAEGKLLAATSWAQYDAVIYNALTRFHDGHLSYHPPSSAAPSRGYDGYRLGLQTVLGPGDRLLVSVVDAGSDLATAGVAPGDEVTAIDGAATATVIARAVDGRIWSRPESARSDWASSWTSVLYPKGDPPRARAITVQPRRGGAPKAISITPQLAPKRGDRVTATIDGDVAIVTIRSLDPAKGRLAAIDAAFATARAARGIVLDLRGDRGGVDTVGHRIVAALGEGTLALGTYRVLVAPETLARRPRWKHLVAEADGYSAAEVLTVDGLPAGQGFHGPIAVVMDASCASTCETVVAALRADLHAVLVGVTTAGSSGAPVEVTLPASRATIAIPTWNLISAEGRAIESDGVAPDVTVIPTPDAIAADGDPVLHAARDAVRTRLTP